jgi:hypothetical protein
MGRMSDVVVHSTVRCIDDVKVLASTCSSLLTTSVACNLAFIISVYFFFEGLKRDTVVIYYILYPHSKLYYGRSVYLHTGSLPVVFTNAVIPTCSVLYPVHQC